MNSKLWLETFFNPNLNASQLFYDEYRLGKTPPSVELMTCQRQRHMPKITIQRLEDSQMVKTAFYALPSSHCCATSLNSVGLMQHFRRKANNSSLHRVET